MLDGNLDRRQFVGRLGLLGLGAVIAPAALLEACGGSTGTTASTSSTAIDQVAPISILINDSPWLPGFQALVKLYEQKSQNQVTLNVTPFSGMLEKSRNAVQASTSEFDIVNLNEQWYMPFYAAGQVTPIREIDPSFQLDPNVIEYEYATRWDPKLKYSTKEGELYGLPINGNIQLYYYRTDLLQKAGMKVPTTWTEVDAFARAVTSKPNVYGWADRTNPSDWEYQSWLESFGSYIVRENEKGAWSVGIDSDQAQAATTTWLNLGKTYGPANYASLDYPSILGLMAAGKVAQTVQVCAAAPLLKNPQSSAVVDTIAVGLNPGMSAKSRVTMSGIWVMGIPSNLSRDRKHAGLTFLRWAIGKDAQIAYTQAGAVPVRQDVYTELANDPQMGWWLRAMAASTPYIHGQPRLPETPQIIQALDLGLADIVSGKQSVKDGLGQIGTQVRGILTQGGYTLA